MKSVFRVFISLLVILVSFGVSTRAASQTETVVRVSPAEVSLAPGESVTIEVWVADVTGLWAFELAVSFNPELVQVSDPQPGGFLSTEDGRFFIAINHVDNEVGLVSFDMTQQMYGCDETDPSPRDGSGALIRFTATAQEQSKATFIIEEALLSDRDGFVIPCTIESSKYDHSVYFPVVLAP